MNGRTLLRRWIILRQNCSLDGVRLRKPWDYLDTPKKSASVINSLLFQILWKHKPDEIKRQVLKQDYGDCGLWVTNVEIMFQVARWDFRVTIPFDFEWLEHLHIQSDWKSNVTGVLEKDESFKWGTSNQDLSYHSNKITPYSILQKTE